MKKWRMKSLFRFYWTDGKGRKVLFFFLVFFTIASIISAVKIPLMLIGVLLYPALLVAQSSDLNPAWKHTRVKYRALLNVNKDPMIQPHHKFSHLVTFADRQKYGKNRVKKCIHCGCMKIWNQNRTRFAFYKDGHLYKVMPLCKYYPDDAVKKVVK